MKRIIFMLILAILIILPVALMGIDGDVKPPNQIWILLAPLIATIVTSYGVRLFKWLGIPIEDHLLYPIMMKLIEIIAGSESLGGSGNDKKTRVVNAVMQQLKPRELKLLNRRFGSIETAVQAAFEMSSTAKKGGK